MNTPYKDNNYLNKRDYVFTDDNNNNNNNMNASNMIHSNNDISSAASVSGTGSTVGKKKPRVFMLVFISQSDKLI